MKYLITILFFFICTFLSAKNYYVKTGGNNANTGLSDAQAWADITKVNSAFTTFVAGDSILFKGGNTFFGTISITKGGAAGNPIIIGSYGGGKATITAFTTMSGWTNEGGGIYSKVLTTTAQANMVTVDGVQYAIGRTPDVGYLTYQSHVTYISITSSSLTGTPNWTGADVVIRKNDYYMERCKITAQTGGTLSYTFPGTDTSYATNGFGFFIQNDLRTLTTFGEWFHDYGVTNKFYMYFGAVDPTTKNVQVSTNSSVINDNGQSNITVTNLNVTGAIINNINLAGTTNNVSVTNCNILFAGMAAIKIAGGSGAIVTGNNIVTCNRNGVSTDGTNSLVQGNSIHEVGKVPGQVTDFDGYDAIYIVGNGGTVQFNDIHGTGFKGVNLRHTGPANIQYNFIDSSCLTLDDGGGIYTSSPLTALRLIKGNIITNVIGNVTGTNHTAARSCGIYLDESTSGVSVTGNSIAYVALSAIKGHYFNNTIVTDNTTYQSANGIEFVNGGGTAIRNITMFRNIFFATLSTHFSFKSNSVSNDINLFGTADSNYYARPINDNTNLSYLNPSTGNVYKNITLPQWVTLVSQDVHSKTAPKAITNIAQLHLVYNASQNNLTVPFSGLIRTDVKGNAYYNSDVLSPYTSRIYFDSGNVVLPTANAGADQSLTLPTTSTSVTGTGTGGSGTIVAYNWSQISGPNTPSIVSPTNATTTISGLNSGSYTFRFKVTNSIGDTAIDFMQIVVNTGNASPVADAGPDQSITLPASTATLNGNGSHDPDGGIVAYLWSKVSGPTGGTISSPSSAVTGVTGLQQGTYVYSLVVTDNNGATGTDFMQIVVNPAVVPPNQPPVAVAGADQSITLPTNSTTVDGSASFDPDGTIIGYLWRKISGPTGGAITSSTSAITGITGLTQGVYIYQLRVTDNSGDTATDALQITVNAGNQFPVADAGPDQSITLPTNNTTLDGSGSHDPDGTIAAYLWSQLSGPNTATLGTSTSVTTTATGLVQGVYIFRLKVTDNSGDTAVDAIQVTVNAAAPPTPPTATSSANQIIQLPLDSVSVSVSTTGTIVGYQWVLFSGNGGTIVSPTSQTTEIRNIPVGVSRYQITVTDANGLTATSIVQITVNPLPPIPGQPVLLRGYINIK